MDLTEAHFGSNARHPWETSRRAIILDFLRPLVARPRVTILDIGCGDIYLATAIAREFPHVAVVCVDTAFTPEALAEGRAAIARERLGIQVLSALDQVAPGTTADVVLLLDVVEHVADDSGFLSGLVAHGAVGPGTAFLVTAPAFGGLMTRHDVFLRHFRRYRRAELLRLVEKSGLIAQDSGYFFLSLLLARAVAKTLELAGVSRAAPQGVGRWSGGAVLSALIHRVLLLDFALCAAVRFSTRWVVPGLSVYAVARPAARA